MLYCVTDKANYAALVPKSYPAGTVPPHWSEQHYESEGHTALLMRELRFTFETGSAGLSEYLAYPWTHLFSQIGAKSFVIEADASGHFVGHTGAWANARDLLKMGVLFVQDGKWDG